MNFFMKIGFFKILFLLFVCCSGLFAQSGLFVLTSDYATGSLSYLEPGTTVTQMDLLTIHSDAAGRYYDGRLYVVNRLGQDNVIVLDQTNLFKPLIQFSTGNGSNPHDIAIVDRNKAYVSRYASSSLLVVDPENGTILGEIDLSRFADDDGKPEMAQMILVGQYLYVACQRLDTNGLFDPVGPSLLVVIDVDSDEIVDMDANAVGSQAIELKGTNPASISLRGNNLYVAITGKFDELDGGIEVVNTITSESSGILISETELGGDVTWFSMATDSKGFAVVSDPNYKNFVKPVDVAQGIVEESLSGHSGGYIPSLSVDGGRLIIPDRGTFEDPEASGLNFYSVDTHKFIEGPISVGLPPAHVVVMDNKPIPTLIEGAQGKLSSPRRSKFESIHPNPFNSSTTISVLVSEYDHSMQLGVYDIVGRRVRLLSREPLVPGRRNIVNWDGCDENGRIVSSGNYFIAMMANDDFVSTKVTFLK